MTNVHFDTLFIKKKVIAKTEDYNKYINKKRDR